MSVEENQADDKGHPLQKRIGLAIVIICLVLIGILLLVICGKLSHSARVGNDCSRLRSALGSLVFDYGSNHGELPQPVYYLEGDFKKPLYSWRLPVANYFSNYNIGVDKNASWNSSANSEWKTIRQHYARGGWGNGFGPVRSEDFPTETSILGVVGTGTAFGDGRESPKSVKELPNDTILLVQCENTGLHWMQPGDLDVSMMDSEIEAMIAQGELGGFHVGFADGTVWYLSKETPVSKLRLFFQLEEAESHDRENVLTEYRLR